MAQPDRQSTGVPGPWTYRSEDAQHRVLRQLLEACLFEGLLPFRTGPVGPAGWQRLQVSLGSQTLECQGRIRGFGRVRLQPESMATQFPDAYPALVAIVRAITARASQADKLFQQLDATIRHTWQLEQAQRGNTGSGDRRTLSGDALDAALSEGHPYHPCFKSRLGFNGPDLIRYSPETCRGIRLSWLAVPRRFLAQSYASGEGAFLEQAVGQETRYLLRAACHRAGINPANHGLLPVHPWQWQNLQQGSAARVLSAAGVRELDCPGGRYLPGQSLRSLFPLDYPDLASIKLPLGIVNTSSRRHLEPHSVASAPVISAWLGRILDADSRFRDRYPLRILAEYASVGWQPGAETSAAAALSGELAAIWRRPLSGCLASGERAIPMNALYAIEADGQPFIQPWVERHGLEPWLSAALATIIRPVWHLLVAQGVGLEAHGQNSLLVVRDDGWPVALTLRDFHDSVEYVDSFLQTGAPRPDFGHRQALYDQAPDNRYYRMDQPDALRELVMDTLFVFNLSELALMLEDHYGLPESDFWQRVRRVLLDYERQHPELAPRIRALGVYQPHVATESLLTALTSADSSGPWRHTVPNTLAPLCAAGGAVSGRPTPLSHRHPQGEYGE